MRTHVHSFNVRVLEFRSCSAFTLNEMLVTSTLFLMLLGGFLSAQLFGVRLYEISKAKLSMTDDAPRIFNQLASEIHSAKFIQVGSGSSNRFAPATLSAPRMGNALQISTSLSGTPYIRYYLDSSDFTLKRMDTNGTISSVARSITNNIVFSIINRFDDILTNEQPQKIIQIELTRSNQNTNGTPYGLGKSSGDYHLITKVFARASE